jgi:hypothetical protein
MTLNYNFSKLRKFLKKKNLISDDDKIESLLCTDNPFVKEKRKRLQIQESLNYYFAGYNQYDFFASEVLEILHLSECLPAIFGTEFLTSDMVLHCFFEIEDPKLYKLFTQMNVTKIQSEHYLAEKWKTISLGFFDRILRKIKLKIKSLFDLSLEREKVIKVNEVIYSEELKTIIENSIKKANFVYKTPIVSLEIFLLTLLEEKGSHSRDLFIKLIPNLRYLLQFRYKILIHILKIEKRMYRLIPTELLAFDYFLKRDLTSAEFYRLTNYPHKHYYAVLNYRNEIIKKILSQNYPEILKSQVVHEILYKPKKIKKFQINQTKKSMKTIVNRS